MKVKIENYVKSLLLGMLFIGLSVSAFAQTQKITGQVKGADDNQPLISVTVKVKDGKAIAVTDAKGNFSIDAEPNATLIFSYTGYDALSQAVGGQSSLSVSLKPSDNSLNEVVVVGYGTQKVKNLTTAISKLDNQTLQSAPRANIGQALQGTLPGLQVINSSGTPGAAPKIILRGGASINAPGNPLVVIDGVVREYNDIASEDIASVQILKDAASTAIYGARANNGVLLITTKQATAGKSAINYKFTVGFNQRRQGYKYLNAGDYLYYTRSGNLYAGRTPTQINASRGFGIPTSPGDLASFDVRVLSDATKDLLTQGWQQMTDPVDGKTQLLYKDHGGEMENILFRNTYTKDHYISAEGGNDKGKYFASFDAYNEDGIIVGSSYKRYTGSLNGSYKVKPNIEIQSGVNLSTASSYGVAGNETGALYRTPAIWPTFNPWLDAAKTQPNPGQGINDGNPLYWLDKLKQNKDKNKVTVNASVKWDLSKDLYVKATGSAYLQESLARSYQYPTQLYANVFATPVSFANSSRTSTAAYTRDFQKTFNVIANYTKTFAEKHDVSAMIGAESFQISTFGLNQLGQNAATDAITTANASTLFPATTSNTAVLPTNGLDNASAAANASNYATVANGNAFSQFAIFSQFARATYGYDNRYLFTAVVRRDQVSNLPSANKAGIFPGFSLGWNLHNESFFKNSSISKYVSSFKPRISYGVNGNINGLGRYESQGLYGSQSTYNGAGGFLQTLLPNNNLQWERSTTLDAGLDAGLFNDRLNITIDYYNKVTADLLTNINLPDYTGFVTYRTNLGTLQNRGIELSISGDVVNQNGWRVNVGANASFVKNKVLKLPYNGNGNNRQGGLQVFDPTTGKVIWVGGIQEGQPLGDVYGFKQLGIFKDQAEVDAIAGNRYDAVALIAGKNNASSAHKIAPGDVNWQDVDHNDTIDSRDQVRLGNIYPKWTGGFNTTASYKGFSLYSRWEFATGYIVYNDLVARTMGNFQGTTNYLDLMKESWTPNNTNTDIPRVRYADQVPISDVQNYTRINKANVALNSNNSNFYERGDYLALREVTLSYNFPKSILQKTKILGAAKIFATGTNLAYITKFSGQNPEAPVDANGNLTGIYAGSFPLARTYVLGIQVTF